MLFWVLWPNFLDVLPSTDTTSRDTDVFLSELLPPNVYYRLNAPHIGEVLLDETDKLQLDSTQTILSPI